MKPVTLKQYEDYFDKTKPENDEFYWMIREMYAKLLAEMGEEKLAKAQKWMIKHKALPVFANSAEEHHKGFNWWNAGDSASPHHLPCFLSYKLYKRLTGYKQHQEDDCPQWKSCNSRHEAEEALANALDGYDENDQKEV